MSVPSAGGTPFPHSTAPIRTDSRGSTVNSIAVTVAPATCARAIVVRRACTSRTPGNARTSDSITSSTASTRMVAAAGSLARYPSVVAMRTSAHEFRIVPAAAIPMAIAAITSVVRPPC